MQQSMDIETTLTSQIENYSSTLYQHEKLNEQEEQYKKLYVENPDFIGWLAIDGTNIDYPVMLTPDDPEFYLRRGFNKQFSLAGTPFIDARCSINPMSDNIIIYGHNMKDDTMFSDILKYSDYDFFIEHPSISFGTLESTKRYEIVAAFYSEVHPIDSNVFKYYNFIDAKTAKDYDAFISNIKNLSLYETNIFPIYGDKLITLSTCSYHSDEGRFVIVAKVT